MKKSNTRFLAVLLALTFCLAFGLSGCAEGDGPGSSGGEQVTLRFWHIWGGQDANAAAAKQVVADFNDSHPNIKVEVETFENEAYKTMIRTAVSGGEAADIFSTWGAGFSRPFYDAGKLLNLDSYLKDGTLNKLYGGALSYFTYDGGVYGMTFGRNVSGFFVNPDVFDAAGAKIPATWDELTDACEKIKANGSIPIITSSKERWVMGMLFEGMVTKAAGADLVNKTLNKEEGGSYADPKFRIAIDRLSELISQGYINSDMGAIDRNEARESFKNGEAGLYYMGSWEVSSLEEDGSAVQGKADWIPFPTIPNGGGQATDFNGGSIDGIVIGADTKYPEQAAAFVKYFCENMERVGDYMPVWNTTELSANTPAVFNKMIDATKNATDYVIWWDTFLTGDDVTTYQDALDNFVNGTIDTNAFIEQLKKIQP